MDWRSRKAPSWWIFATMNADFCIDALEEALTRYGTPEIFNADQGNQGTSVAFVNILQSQGVRISTDFLRFSKLSLAGRASIVMWIIYFGKTAAKYYLLVSKE